MSIENVFVKKLRKSAKQGTVPAWKRVLDLSFVMLLLPGWLLMMAGISLLIKLVSKGPIFYEQDRIGIRERTFRLIKFRTLHSNSSNHADHMEELIRSNKPMEKMNHDHDLNLIPLGKFLRTSGLDELPQIINVLKGDMSIVGPRPCTIYEFQHYLPYHKRRCNTLPGITGLWQVSGKNSVSFSEMIRLDTFYVDYASPSMDLKILLKTVGLVFRRGC